MPSLTDVYQRRLVGLTLVKHQLTVLGVGATVCAPAMENCCPSGTASGTASGSGGDDYMGGNSCATAVTLGALGQQYRVVLDAQPGAGVAPDSYFRFNTSEITGSDYKFDITPLAGTNWRAEYAIINECPTGETPLTFIEFPTTTRTTTGRTCVDFTKIPGLPFLLIRFKAIGATTQHAVTFFVQAGTCPP